MLLDLRTHNYDTDIAPFIRNGIIVDTSVMKHLIDGLIRARIERKKINDLSEYKMLLQFLDLLKINNRWNCLYVTPHILTEICNHVRNDYCKRDDYKRIVGEVLPIIEKMGEYPVTKDDFIKRIEIKNPIMEAGDISIFVASDELMEDKQRKTAILSNDAGVNSRYTDHPRIMVMDYRANIINSY